MNAGNSPSGWMRNRGTLTLGGGRSQPPRSAQSYAAVTVGSVVAICPNHSPVVLLGAFSGV